MLGAVIWGTLLVVLGRPPGEALALYVMGYGAARFVFEFARGDMGRPDIAGFSEAQWTVASPDGSGAWRRPPRQPAAPPLARGLGCAGRGVRPGRGLPPTACLRANA